MKPIRIILAALALFAAIGLTPKAQAQNYGTPFLTSSTTGALASATTNQVIPLSALPANAGNFIFKSAQIICTSGSTSGTVPIVSIIGATTGSTPVLSSTALVTGTGTGYYTNLPAVSGTGAVVITGTTGKTLGLLVNTSGTSAAYSAQVVIEGYYVTTGTGL